MEKVKLDRTQAPAAAPLTKVLFPEVGRHTLSNGIPVYTVQFGSQDIVEVNVVFPAGRSFEPQLGVANFTSRLMQEGTKNYTGLEFARKLDEYGTFLGSEVGYESTNFSLTSLTKYMKDTVPLMAEVLLRPVFPEKELQLAQARSIRNLEVEQKKTSFIARRGFNQLLHGTHPYGNSATADDIKALNLEALKQYHATNFAAQNAFVVASGRFDEQQLLDVLNEAYARHATNEGVKVTLQDSLSDRVQVEPGSGLHVFEKAESMQATIRVGHRAFKRQTPDFYPMQVVATVLGGYFGSRLMRNIREDKGFTYGIHAGWLSMKFGGTFLIQTDVGNEYIRPTLEEIRKEINLLIDKGVSADELNLVKNYMLGRSASARETPSQVATMMRTCLVNDLPISVLDDKFDVIQAVQPEDIKRLAAQYLRPDALLEVVCGKMEETPQS